MSKNFNIFIKLDKDKYANKYVVIVNKKVIASGQDIVSMLKLARKRYPKTTPFVAKVPDRSVLVL